MRIACELLENAKTALGVSLGIGNLLPIKTGCSAANALATLLQESRCTSIQASRVCLIPLTSINKVLSLFSVFAFDTKKASPVAVFPSSSSSVSSSVLPARNAIAFAATMSLSLDPFSRVVKQLSSTT